MYIRLINFRSFSDSTFNLCNDFTIITGKSGVGKTTIFMGIIFAFTGEGKKLVRYGSKSCKVILTLDDVVITRTKSPNVLRVTIDDQEGTLEDKEAQSYIHKRYADVTLGYVSQRMHKSFILMTPADKLKYVEGIVTNKEYVVMLKNNCKNMIKKRKDERSRLQTELITLTTHLDDIGINTKQKFETHLKPTQNIKIMHQTRDNLIKALYQNKAFADQRDTMAELTRDIEELENKLGPSKCQLTLEEANTLHRNYVRWKEVHDSSYALSPEVSVLDINEMISDMENLLHLEEVIDKLTLATVQLPDLTHRRNTVAVRYTCPSCSTRLGVLNDNIMRMSEEESVDSNLIMSTEEASVLLQKWSQCTSDHKRCCEAKQKRAAILTSYEAHINPTVQLALLREGLVRKQTVEPRIHIGIEDMCALKEYYEKQVLLQQLLAFIPSDKRPVLEIQAALDEVDQNIQMHYTSKINTKKDRVCCLDDDIQTAIELQHYIIDAEKEAMTSMIDNLNLYIKSYCTKFVDHIDIQLLFNEDKLMTQLYVNDHESDISSISGGELARVIVAVTLAFADLYDCKLLMLDESMASLDQDTSNCVIETIKEYYTGKVLCIAHQTSTGIYDEMISL